MCNTVALSHIKMNTGMNWFHRFEIESHLLYYMYLTCYELGYYNWVNCNGRSVMMRNQVGVKPVVYALFFRFSINNPVVTISIQQWKKKSRKQSKNNE